MRGRAPLGARSQERHNDSISCDNSAHALCASRRSPLTQLRLSSLRLLSLRSPLPRGERGTLSWDWIECTSILLVTAALLRPLPACPLRAVFQDDALGRKVLADAVGLGEVLGLARLLAGFDLALDLGGVDAVGRLQPVGRVLLQEAHESAGAEQVRLGRAD